MLEIPGAGAEPAPIPLARRALAEMLASAALVFAGCGAIVTETVRPGTLGNAGIALAFALTVAVLAAATGPISGGHFNPAVTVSLVVGRRFPIGDALAYVPAQLVGALLGAAALAVLWPNHPAALGATSPSVAIEVALVYEALMTALLMFVVRAVGGNAAVGPLATVVAIGSVVGLDALVGGPLTGASMNPARSFGPAVMTAQVESLWIYLVGPVAGAIAGSAAFDAVRPFSPARR